MEGTVPDLKDVLDQPSDVIDKSDESNKFNSLDSMKDLLETIDTNSNNSLNKTWSKLNKTDKLKLINNFIESEYIEKNIDKSKLEKILHSSFKNNLLRQNKKTFVIKIPQGISKILLKNIFFKNFLLRLYGNFVLTNEKLKRDMSVKLKTTAGSLPILYK